MPELMSRPIRILFIGEMHSSHALNWIDLLRDHRDEFEILGLHVSLLPPPQAAFPIVDAKDLSYFKGRSPVKLWRRRTSFNKADLIYEPDGIYGLGALERMQFANAQRIIRDFAPDIVHSLGIFPASVFYARVTVLSEAIASSHPHWIVQARGGPDLALNRQFPALAPEITTVLKGCDTFIADNEQNYVIAQEMGLSPDKISQTGPVPGSGGIDPTLFGGVPLPSQKEPLILWPKAYNCIQSDGLTVVEALKLALPKLEKFKIKNFRLVATAAVVDIEYWLKETLGHYGDRIEIHARLPHSQMMDLYRSARVLLAPSLSEGIPNSMYEAMASHTVPILSPLPTLEPLFQPDVHTLYAPNLQPASIAKALVRAMTDDALADSIAKTNRAWLPELAGRENVRDRVINLYRQLPHSS